MHPKLHTFLHQNLSTWDLLDASLKPTPEKNNPWALWCGWVLDWVLALIITKLCVGSWMTFMNSLGLGVLPSQALEFVALKTRGLEVILTPLIFFTLHYTSLNFHSKTLGQKLFKHHVQFSDDKGVWLYTLALMVSPVLMGIPLLNSWVDEFAGSETVSKDYSYYVFTLQTEIVESINLVDQLATELEEFEDYQQAA
jgi:hypothetical protein